MIGAFTPEGWQELANNQPCLAWELAQAEVQETLKRLYPRLRCVIVRPTLRVEWNFIQIRALVAIEGQTLASDTTLSVLWIGMRDRDAVVSGAIDPLARGLMKSALTYLLGGGENGKD